MSIKIDYPVFVKQKLITGNNKNDGLFSNPSIHLMGFFPDGIFFMCFSPDGLLLYTKRDA